MIADDPVALAELVAAGLDDDDARRWLADGLARWLRAAGAVSLQRCLHLPERPAGLRRAIGRRWMREACSALPAGLTPWQAATVLADAARRFDARTWPCWRSLAAPPVTATRLEVTMFYARRSRAAPLPSTAQAYIALTRSAKQLRDDPGSVELSIVTPRPT